MKNIIKKHLKFKMQKDFLIAFTITATFFGLQIFDEIDWKFIWLVSPIWLLLSVYFVCSSVAMGIYFMSKKFKK